MTSFKASAICTTALTSLLGAQAALADLTAQQVWDDWRGYMEASGYELSAIESPEGNDLNVSDITMTIAVPEEDVTFTLTIPELSLSGNGDGTVSMSWPSVLPLTVTIDDLEGETVDVAATYATEGLSVAVSGDPDNIDYAYSADKLGITVDNFTTEGVTIDMSTLGTVEFSASDFDGASTSSGRTLREMTQKITTGAINILVDVKDPEGSEGRLVVRAGADSMTSDGVYALPENAAPEDMSAMMAAGFKVDGEIDFTGGSIDVNFNEDGEVFQYSSSSDAAGLGITMNADKFSYSIGSEGMNVAMAGGDIPFPVEFSAAETGFEVDMPIGISDEQQDFGFGFTIAGFEMSDLIWGIFDPTVQLPRDPATIALVLNGTVTVLADFFDPAQVLLLDSDEIVPGELNSLNLDTLQISAAGVELTGEGAFTFDNSDLASFDGFPTPTGSVNLMLRGGNALLDKLVDMGLIPREQATGARMMMGLFAVAGSEPDTLSSTIEVQGNGKVFANGQRIQ